MGDIPQGLPQFSVPKAFSYAKSLIPTALLITGVAILVGFSFSPMLAVVVVQLELCFGDLQFLIT